LQERRGHFDRQLDYLTLRLLSRTFQPASVPLRCALPGLSQLLRVASEDAKKLLSVGESKPEEGLLPIRPL
jgi:hypothetical protein